MRKSLLAVLALGLVASFAPLSAQADHCNRNMVIFSSPIGINSNVAVCAVDEGEDVDGRILYPGSTGFSGRYTVDLGADVPFIWVDLTGSFVDQVGVVHPLAKRVKAPRSLDSTLGFWSYNFPTQTMPGGRTATGCVTATADVPDDELNSTTYRHLGATC